MKRLFSVLLLLPLAFFAWSEGVGTLDLRETVPNWKCVLSGECVCQPVPSDDGVVLLTDGRTVVFLTEKGKVKWQCRIKGRSVKNFFHLIPVTAGLIAASSADTLSMINANGTIVWTRRVSHEVESVWCSGSGIVASGDGKETTLGIRGSIKSERAIKSGGKSLPPAGKINIDKAAGRHIIMPDIASKDTSYTVMTRGGYLLLFDESWLVRAWHVTEGDCEWPRASGNKGPSNCAAGAGGALAEPALSKAEKAAVLNMKGYVHALGTSSKDAALYKADLLGTFAMFDAAVKAEVAEVSPLIANAIELETNATLLTALFEAASAQAFDEGDMMAAIDKKARRISVKEEGALVACCGAVESICRFMGGSERLAAGVSILSELSDARYSVKVRARARAALASLGA